MKRRSQRLWYRKPGANWNEALPVGNGRIGAMLYGAPWDECICMNEDTLWTGRPRTVSPDANAPDIWKQAANFTQHGQMQEAEQLLQSQHTGLWSQAYLPLCDIHIRSRAQFSMEHYERELCLDYALHRVMYSKNEVDFVRETFVSFPDQVMVTRITSNVPGTVCCHCSMTPSLDARLSMRDGRIAIEGHAPVLDWKNGDPYRAGQVMTYADTPENMGMGYAAEMRILPKGGTMHLQGGGIEVVDADELLILFDARTSFVDWKTDPVTQGADYRKLLQTNLDKACKRSYDELLKRHLRDYQPKYRRVVFDMKGTNTTSLPTDEQLYQLEEGNEDLSLYCLYYQYARYLTLASSREGTQPSNLQGIWNPLQAPPWNSNYTLNINTEMNYWPTLMGNLRECMEPLLKMIEELSLAGTKTAQDWYGLEGACANHNTDLWRLSWPVGSLQSGSVQYAAWPMALAWLSRSLWEAYSYDQDLTFLKERCLPVFERCAAFVKGLLQEDGEGLIVTPATSPENRYLLGGQSIGVDRYTTMSQEIAWDLFHICSEAYRAAGDMERSKEYAGLQDRLKLPRIHENGTLMEWSDMFEEEDVHHRHLSHLYGLYPGERITWKDTPELAEAVKQSLLRRGDISTGWAMAWRICLWARLGDGNHALQLLRRQLRCVSGYGTNYHNGGGTYLNLLDAHPPFQIDGNFGAAAGMMEMLVQMRGGILYLLPALPDAWVKGEIRGVRLPGGYEINMRWAANRLVLAQIKCLFKGELHLSDGRVFQHEAKETLQITDDD